MPKKSTLSLTWPSVRTVTFSTFGTILLTTEVAVGSLMPMSVGVALSCPRTTYSLLGGIEKRIAANAAAATTNAATDATRKVAGASILFLVKFSYLTRVSKCVYQISSFLCHYADMKQRGDGNDYNYLFHYYTLHNGICATLSRYSNMIFCV